MDDLIERLRDMQELLKDRDIYPNDILLAADKIELFREALKEIAEYADGWPQQIARAALAGEKPND